MLKHRRALLRDVVIEGQARSGARKEPRQLGLLKKTGHAFAVESIDKKDMKEWPIRDLDTGGAKDGELVRFQNSGFLVHPIQGIGVKNATTAKRLTAPAIR